MKEIKYKELNLKYNFIDIKAKTTLLLVHGFNSSSDAFKNLYDKKVNFNIVAINFPREREFNTYEMADIVDFFISQIKGEVVVLGHSLGGAILTHVKDKRRIKEYIFVSALSPILAENKGIDFFSKDSKAKSALKTIISTAANAVGQSSLAAFLKPPKGFIKVTKENITNKKYLQEELYEGYIKKQNKAISMIGTLDPFFPYKRYDEFMSSVNIKNIIITNSAHNPFESKIDEVTTFLNDQIQFKKRFFKKIIKNN